MSSAIKLIRNTAYHAVGRIWQIAVGLFMSPLILSYLGDSQFALWVLLWTFSTYFMFMDFGLGVSLVRDTASCEDKKACLPVSQAVNSLILFYVILGAAVTLAFWLAQSWIIGYLDVSLEVKTSLLDMLLFAGIIFSLIGIVNTLSALLKGLQRYDKVTKAMIYTSFPNVIGSYLVLDYGMSIKGLLWVVSAVYLFQIVLLVIYSKQLMPDLRFGFRYLSWIRVKEMLPFGMQIQVSKFAELSSYQSDKILLAMLMPLQFVTMYDLGSRIASLIRDVPYSLTSAVFPATAELYKQKDFEKLWKMYDRGSKYLLVVTIPMLFGLWITAHLLIGMWLGNVSSEVYQSVLILSFAYWMVIALAMSFSVAIGMGWSKPILQSALIQAFLNLGLSYWLITEIGFLGALYGTLIAISIANSILYYRFCSDFGRTFREEAGRLVLVIMANLPPVIICAGVVIIADSWLIWGDRLQSFIVFALAVLSYGVSYMWSLRWIKVFDIEDARLLGDKIPLMNYVLRVRN